MNSAQILERLVGFPTVSRDSNLALIEYVRDFLSARGIGSKLYMDATGRKANLFASIGPPDRAGVLLSGHTDVVPVDGQSWSSNPFELRARSGLLFARGAADMKGFLACALRAMDQARIRTLAVPLQLAFSYDEEVGCLGVRSLIEDMGTWACLPKLCIVGEPTLLRTAVGHKGKTAVRATCHGLPAHSASPDRGVNAIYMASNLIERIRTQQADIICNGAKDAAFDVPHTTLHVGVIEGGTVLNIVPSRCELEFEIRNLTADDPTALLAEIRSHCSEIVRGFALPAQTGLDGEAHIDFQLTHEYPGLDTSADADVVGFVAALTGNRECIKVGFGSEAGLFSGRLGIPSVVCGPGSIDQAHKADEFIALDQLVRCDAMMDALLGRLV
jgi:acetylornithine deacetylase